jgi:hypothetical protein
MKVTFRDVTESAITLSPEDRSQFMMELREFSDDYVTLDAGDWLRKYSISKAFSGDPKTQCMQDLARAKKR